MILTPAYGRDYKSKKELLADFEADKDFVGHDYRGAACINRSQLREMGIREIQARYSKLTKVCMVKVGTNGK